MCEWSNLTRPMCDLCTSRPDEYREAFEEHDALIEAYDRDFDLRRYEPALKSDEPGDRPARLSPQGGVISL